jgi:hypothetical protein
VTNFGSIQIGSKACRPLLVVLAMLVSITGMAQSRRLITGKSILWPPLGTQQNVGNLPVNIILSPNGKYAITTDTGFNEIRPAPRLPSVSVFRRTDALSMSPWAI